MRKKNREIAISNAELAAMTKSMDEMHYDQSLPALNEAVSKWTDSIREEQAADPELLGRSTSRRHFLMGTGGLIVGGAVLAACGSSGSSSSTTSAGSGGGAGSSTMGGSSSLSASDAGSMRVDASIENLAVFAYDAGISAAKAGKLGAVPPAVPVFAETALSHHKAHLAAFNAVLTSAGMKAITVPEPALTPTVKTKFGQVKDIVGLAELAVLLENVAAQSYQDDAGNAKNQHAAETAATIQPVEMTHAAILYFVLGKYPGSQSDSGSPLSFNPLTLARPSSDVKAS